MGFRTQRNDGRGPTERLSLIIAASFLVAIALNLLAERTAARDRWWFTGSRIVASIILTIAGIWWIVLWLKRRHDARK